MFIGNYYTNERKKTKYKIHNLVRTVDLKKTISKRDTTNWLYKLYKITENITDTIERYRIDNSKKDILNRY